MMAADGLDIVFPLFWILVVYKQFFFLNDPISIYESINAHKVFFNLWI